jgi:hypothetical protein
MAPRRDERPRGLIKGARVKVAFPEGQDIMWRDATGSAQVEGAQQRGHGEPVPGE